MFLFLRSFLIVMFSCCQQSLDLSADEVSRYINDTANSVSDDVMRFKSHSSRKRDRVDFDDFGEWYNLGGFETAPWLELLDLKKWVLVDNFDALNTHVARLPNAESGGAPIPSRPVHHQSCPPPPPEDSIDHSFFNEDDNGIMPIDSIDEMDIILMQQPSQDKENDSFPVGKITMSFSYSPDQQVPNTRDRHANSLKFHIVTDDEHGGYMLSLSQKRIRHLRHLLVESGLYQIDSDAACRKIVSKGSPPSMHARRSSESSPLLMREDFDSAMRSIISTGVGKASMSSGTQKALSDMLACLFTSFDRGQKETVSAIEMACGFTVVCQGKKSDKLEYAFEMLDQDKDGLLSRAELGNYLRSFLTVLLSIAVTPALDSDPTEDSLCTMTGTPCEPSPSMVVRAVDSGSKWASTQAFLRASRIKGKVQSGEETISFDEFADWYTNVGYSSIPWLELLDLRKWVITDS